MPNPTGTDEGRCVDRRSRVARRVSPAADGVVVAEELAVRVTTAVLAGTTTHDETVAVGASIQITDHIAFGVPVAAAHSARESIAGDTAAALRVLVGLAIFGDQLGHEGFAECWPTGSNSSPARSTECSRMSSPTVPTPPAKGHRR
jgi:hypothetical protein